VRLDDPLVEGIPQAGALAGADTESDVVADLIGRLRPLRRLVASVAVGTLAGGDTAVSAVRAVCDALAPPGESDELGRFGPYGILRVLGSGGMGVVFAARQPRPRRVVALKMILAGPHAGPGRLARFRSEIEIVGRLRHPNIVQVHEAGDHDGRPYFAMEYVEGGSLAEKLAAAPLPAREAAALVEALARAVQFAHEQGVVHRDLKPSNVLLAACGLATDAKPQAALPKIADFGLAKQLQADVGERTESGAILGTPAYMAPEAAAGRPGAAGPAVDVYALGAILYECLSGRPPFKAATPAETLVQVLSAEPVPPSRLQPGVPRDLQTLCLKCLEKEPARRYASALELADDLRRFGAGEPIRARPVSAWRRLAKWARRKPALAGLLSACGLLLGALVAGALLYQSWLRAAVRRAEAKEAEARQQRELAAEHYRQAHDTLERMFRRLEDGRLAEIPRLQELRRDLLQDALAFYQEILHQADSPDPVVRRDTAVACKRAGDIQHVLGQGEAAAANYRRAIALVEGRPAADRDAALCQTVLAGCHNNLGLLANDARRWDEAEREHRAALGIFERLARERRDDAAAQSGVADSEHDLGAVYQLSDRPADAVPHYTRAITLRAALVHDYPHEERYQAALADDYVDLALLYQQTGRDEEVAPTSARAEALLRPLADRHAPGERYALSLAGLYINWGYFLAAHGESAQGLKLHDQAVRLADAALLHEPQDTFCRQRALRAHGARAEVLEFLGKFADSVKDWDRVVDLAEGPARIVWRGSRARLLARAGDHARAVAEADDLAARPDTPAPTLYGVAWVYALEWAATRAGTSLAPAERDGRAERYASRAVALLRQLQGQGYFKDAAHVQELRGNKDLWALHDREDFRPLLADVAGDTTRDAGGASGGMPGNDLSK
jgi:hypothetical protein